MRRAGAAEIRPVRVPYPGDRVASATAWLSGGALLCLTLWTLPGFFGPRAFHPAALLAGAGLGYLCCGPHRLSRRGRWLAVGLLSAATALFVMRSAAAAALVDQSRFLVTAWSEGATPAVPDPLVRPLLAACAWPLSCVGFDALRRTRAVNAVLVLIGWIAIEWEFLDQAAGQVFWPAAALALLWMAAGRAQTLAGRPAFAAGRAPDARRLSPARSAWWPLLLAAATAMPLLAAVALLPLNRPAINLGALGPWLRHAVPAVGGIERSARLLRGTAGAAAAANGGQIAPTAPFGLQMEGFATNDSSLGGPLATTDAEALRLTVVGGNPPPTIYLRGEALDTYTGRGWVESHAALQGGPPPSHRFFGPQNPSFTLRVQPTGLVTSTLFTALTPAGVNVSPLTWDRLGNAWLPDPLPPSRSYLVRVVPPPDPAALPLRSPFFGLYHRLHHGLSRRFAAYLQLPPSLPPQVRSLARSWAAGASTPLEQVLAIQRHLLAIPYDLNAPAPPPGSDFVAAFLFQIRRGYCTYYSSAMAVMLRTLGVPTRWVVGFRVPTPPPGRTAVVTDAEAHAWVEAFIPPYGWLTFDPTPPGPTLRPAATVTATLTPAPAVVAATPAHAATRALDGSTLSIGLLRTAGSRTPAVLAAILAAALGGLLVARRLRERRLAGLGSVAAAHLLWRSVEREATRRGYPRRRGATPGEFARLLAEAWPPGQAAAVRLADAYGRLCYGPASERPAAAADLDRDYRALTAELRRLSRARLRRRVRHALGCVARWAAACRPARWGRRRGKP